MGRKIRTGVLLILVLAMIYTQQAVIYAQNEAEKNIKKMTESEIPDENKEPDKEPDKEPEQPGGEEGDKEQEKPGGEDEDKDKEPEQPEIKRYELEISKADGKNGYYLSKPSVMITHNGCYGTTVYELKHGEDILSQGRIEYAAPQAAEEQKTKISLEGEVFEEGKNILHVFMEDEEGNVIPEYDETIEILIDTQSPTVTLEAPEGFSTWYQKEAWIRVLSEDGAWGSQIDMVTCYVGNKIIGKAKENQPEFLITQTSKSGEGVPVTVTVTDQAGNKTEKTQKLFIDSLAPTVSLTGAADYMITSQPVTIEYQVADENKLESCQAVIDYEKPDGEKKTEVIDSEEKWSLKNESACFVKTFQEDGIYKTSVQAVDKAKWKSEHFLQFMIDTKNPVIKMVDELQGKYLKRFSWDYPVDVFIKDFTTFVHQIQMDGRLYPIGTEIDTEGRHTLQVNAIDAAGNEAVARAEFVIDHTPPKIRFYQVEEGAQYEGILNFQVDCRKKEDWIEEVLINGKRQTLKKEDGKYTFQITNPGEYEVSVIAADLAWNEAEENISFEIVPEKTILEKAAAPIQKILSGNTEKEQKNLQGEKENSHFDLVKWIVIGSSITILLIMAGVVWCKRKKDNTKEGQADEE